MLISQLTESQKRGEDRYEGGLVIYDLTETDNEKIRKRAAEDRIDVKWTVRMTGCKSCKRADDSFMNYASWYCISSKSE